MSWLGRMRAQLGHASLWRLHAASVTLTLTLNFGCKGFELWLGQYVASLGLPLLSRTIYYAVNGGKILGDLVSMGLTGRIGRLRCLQLGFSGAAVGSLLLVVSMQPDAVGLLVALTLLTMAFADMVRARGHGRT